MRLYPRNPWPLILSVPLGLIGSVMARYAVLLPWIYDDLVREHPPLKIPFLVEGYANLVRSFSIALGCGGAVVLLAAVAGIMARRGWVLWVLRKAYWCVYLVFAGYLLLVNRLTSTVLAANVAIDGVTPDPVVVFFWRYDLLILPILAVIGFAFLHIMAWRAVAIEEYTGVPFGRPAPGDLILENLRSNGRDPDFRKGMFSSVGIHLLVILVIPWLLSMRGCVDPYLIQKGSGTPEVAGVTVVKIVKAKKKEKKKKYVLNSKSAISFHIPDLDESQLAKEVEKETEVTYQADPTRMMSGAGRPGGSGSGKLGAGGGTEGGWPEGMENGKVRFIRLEHDGPGWDDGMDAVSRADLNFLEEFHRVTGFKVSDKTESHPVRLLRKYDKGFAPPFVYLTGNGKIGVSDADIKTLRTYLTDGGMLFADAASPAFDKAFRNLARSIFPGEQLLVIADDDPIFQMPFAFPNGAPPLWHHGGNRAMGIKYKGRWCVFYHPGDVNDAWKTGHSGLSTELWRSTFELGVNIVYYSFTHYLEETRKYRK